jgi:frataxin-like iron-binding protein CyaY
MNEELDFKKRADAALSLLGRDLAGAAEDYGFQCGASAGTISVDCGTPGGKIVISRNPQAQQIQVQVGAKTYKLDWDIVEAGFVHLESGQTLRGLIEQALSKQLRQEVTL